MSSLDSCYFQEILDIKSSVKVTLFTLDKASFLRNTCPIISFLYFNKMYVQNYPSESRYHSKKSVLNQSKN